MNEESLRRLRAAKTVSIKPFAGTARFSVAIPGSKSLANRALLLAAVADGTSCLAALPESDDIRAALSALSALGIAVRRRDDILEVDGSGGAFPASSGTVEIGSSGTVGRFLPGLLAASRGEWLLASSEQLAKRPLDPLLTALRQLGADVESVIPGKSFPLRVRGGGLAGGGVTVSAKASSQFASGVLMAAPLCRRPVEVLVADLDPEEAYIDLTLHLMRRFGAESHASRSDDGLLVRVDAPRVYHPVDLVVEADFNSALYYLSLPLLVGGTATVSNIAGDSLQPGRKFLDVLARLGGDVSTGPGGVSVVGDGRPLRGGFSLDMRAMSEMAITLGVLAVFADAPIAMTNLAHIRGHETDRLAVLAKLLAAVGVRCEEGPDWIKVYPCPKAALKPARLDSHDDHRVVMSFALLGLAANGLSIDNPGAVAKTFPEFFDTLAAIGAAVAFDPPESL